MGIHTTTKAVLANTQLPSLLKTHTRTHFLAVLYFLPFYFLELVKKNNCQYIWPIADFVSGVSFSYLVTFWKQPVNVNPDPEWKLKVVLVYYSNDASESDSWYSQTIYTHTNYYKYTILSFHTPYNYYNCINIQYWVSILLPWVQKDMYNCNKQHIVQFHCLTISTW